MGLVNHVYGGETFWSDGRHIRQAILSAEQARRERLGELSER